MHKLQKFKRAVAVLLNVALLAFFVWLVFNPLPLFREVPEREFAYLVPAIYPAFNLVALILCYSGAGPARYFRRFVLGINFVLLVIGVAFGIADAAHNGFTDEEQFETFWLLFPPVVTLFGFKLALPVSRRIVRHDPSLDYAPGFGWAKRHDDNVARSE